MCCLGFGINAGELMPSGRSEQRSATVSSGDGGWEKDEEILQELVWEILGREVPPLFLRGSSASKGSQCACGSTMHAALFLGAVINDALGFTFAGADLCLEFHINGDTDAVLDLLTEVTLGFG